MSTPLSEPLPPTSGQEQSLHACLDLPVSLLLAREIRAQPNQCYANTWRAFVHRPDLFHNAWFIEGWFVVAIEDQIALNEHSWISMPGSGIVDPSVLLIVPPGTPVFYFPGVARTWDETVALEGELFPQVCFDGQHGDDGLRHAGYHAAREAARRKVYALALEQTPPATMRFLHAQEMEATAPPPVFMGMTGDAETVSRIEQVGNRDGDPVLDLAFSEMVAQEIGAQAGRCWYNVRDALLQMPSPLVFASAVEGWLIEQRDDRIQLIEHGWICWHGRLIDPTIVRKTPGNAHLEYVPGLTFSWAEVQHFADYPLPLARFLVSALSYQDACRKALQRAERLAWQTGLPLVPCPGFVLLRAEEDQQLALHLWEFPVPATLSPAVPRLLQAWWKGGAHV